MIDEKSTAYEGVGAAIDTPPATSVTLCAGKQRSRVRAMSRTPCIQFQPLNFCTLPEELPTKIRTHEGMTLIDVKPSGAARYGRTRADKDAIIAEHVVGDLLLLAWTGQWRTDIFLLSAQDIDRHYREGQPS